jgi:hypothetical protein
MTISGLAYLDVFAAPFIDDFDVSAFHREHMVVGG